MGYEDSSLDKAGAGPDIPAPMPAKHRNSKPRLSLVQKVGAGLAGAVLLGGGVFIGSKIGASSEESPSDVPSQPGVSAPVVPGMEETAPLDTEIDSNGSYIESLPRGEELTEMFRIPADLSDQELAETFSSRLDDWGMFGASPELRRELYADMSQDMDPILRDIAAETADGVVPALFADERSDEVNEYITRFTDINAANLSLHVRTSGTSLNDIEPYRQWSEVTGVESFQPDSNDPEARGIIVHYTQYSNTDLNRADDMGAVSVPPEGVDQITTVTFVEEDGYLYITDLRGRHAN